MSKVRSFVGFICIGILVLSNLMFVNPVYAAEWDPPTEEDIENNHYVYYFVNAGTSNPDQIPAGERLGVFQSNTEQEYGSDPVTGKKWGYTTTYKSSARHGSSNQKFESLRYYDAPIADKVPEKGLEYIFEIPNGTYEVTLGYKNPWSTRESNILMENELVDDRYVVNEGIEQEKTYEIDVADEELNVKIVRPTEGGSATSQWADPLVNNIIIRAKVEITKEILAQEIQRAESIDRSDYTEATLIILDEALLNAKVVIEKEAPTKEELEEAYHKLIKALDGLSKPYTSFKPGEVWRDTSGVPIQAHGGGILKVGDTYYWYGEDKTNGYLPATGVHAYSSKDLYNWKDEGVVLKAIEKREDMETDPYFAQMYGHRTEEEKDVIFSDINTARGILERPKVIYNEKTKKYVLWLHVDGPYQGSDANYAKAKAGVAISDSPTGPFEYLESNRLNKAPDGERVYGPDTGMARDMTLFVDDDGVGYIIYSSEENMSLYISKLTDDYLKISGDENGKDYIRALPGMQREAPAMFKYDGKYYLVTSGATGWDPNPAKYAVADSVLGEWTDMGNPVTGAGASTTHQSQSTYIIPVDPENGEFIYMGDRWNKGNLTDSRYIWLPVDFSQDGKLVLDWHDEWTLEDLKFKGKVSILSDLPKAIQYGEEIQFPNQLEVQYAGKNVTVEVDWQLPEDAYLRPGIQTITGEIPEFNHKIIRHQVYVIPKNVVYFANPGNAITPDYVEMKSYMTQSLINQDIFDQEYTDESTWGYSGGDTGTTAGSNIFESLRYITKESKEKHLTYTFEVDDGDYTVFTGFYDPWAVYSKGNRKADVTINNEVVDFEYTYSDRYDVREFPNVQVNDGKIEITVQPSASVLGRPDTDTQISWIMIVDQRENDDSISIDPVNELANKVTGTSEEGTDSIHVVLPNGEKVVAKIKKSGKWKAKLPSQILKPGDVLKIERHYGIFKDVFTIEVDVKPGRKK